MRSGGMVWRPERAGCVLRRADDDQVGPVVGAQRHRGPGIGAHRAAPELEREAGRLREDGDAAPAHDVVRGIRVHELELGLEIVRAELARRPGEVELRLLAGRERGRGERGVGRSDVCWSCENGGCASWCCVLMVRLSIRAGGLGPRVAGRVTDSVRLRDIGLRGTGPGDANALAPDGEDRFCFERLGI